MIRNGCGRALVLVYANGMRESVLVHEHDGGEAYMGPVLRRAVAYAKTHYDSGDITKILLSEPEMDLVTDQPWELAVDRNIRHIYYVAYRWDSASGNKKYSVAAVHLGPDESIPTTVVPAFASGIPPRAGRIV